MLHAQGFGVADAAHVAFAEQLLPGVRIVWSAKP